MVHDEMKDDVHVGQVAVRGDAHVTRLHPAQAPATPDTPSLLYALRVTSFNLKYTGIHK